VTTIDLVPTIAKLLNVPLSDNPIDGLDVWPLLTGAAERSPRKEFLYYAGDELQAVRSGPWKLHLPHEYLTPATPPGKDGKPANFANLKPESMQQSGLRGIASRHGYIVQKIELSLFNLDDDHGEKTNVAADHPQIVARMLKLVESARVDLGDSLSKRSGERVRASGMWQGAN
jgi:arylsulfatase A-like enzyme